MSIRNLSAAMLIHSLDQAKLADCLDIDKSSVSRYINEMRAPSKLDEDKLHAFFSEYGVCIFLQSQKFSLDLSRFSDAQEKRKLVEMALAAASAQGLRQEQKACYLHTAFLADLETSATYDYDEETKTGCVSVLSFNLKRSVEILDQLTRCIKKEYGPNSLLLHGLTLNRCAIRMLQEKAAKQPFVTSREGALAQYQNLYTELRTLLSTGRIQDQKRIAYLRSLVLYCGSAICEISTELRDSSQTRRTFEDLAEFFQNRKVLETFCTLNFWVHNREAFKSMVAGKYPITNGKLRCHLGVLGT